MQRMTQHVDLYHVLVIVLRFERLAHPTPISVIGQNEDQKQTQIRPNLGMASQSLLCRASPCPYSTLFHFELVDSIGWEKVIDYLPHLRT